MRIRSLKPEFWTHPILAAMPDDARLAAIGLLNVADDHGYFLARPALVRSALWPLDEDSTKARRVLAQLSEAGWIEVREHPTHGPIGRVVNFTKHQRVDRPSPSKIAAYWLDDSSSNIRRTLDDNSSLEQGAGSREQGSKDQGGAGGADALLSPAGHIPTPTTDLPGHTRKLTGRDLRLLPAASRLRVARDEQADLDHLVLLYGWDCAQTGIVALAERQPKGPIWLSAYREYLAERFILDSADYRRAGLPVPADVLDREAKEAARGA